MFYLYKLDPSPPNEAMVQTRANPKYQQLSPAQSVLRVPESDPDVCSASLLFPSPGNDDKHDGDDGLGADADDGDDDDNDEQQI